MELIEKVEKLKSSTQMWRNYAGFQLSHLRKVEKKLTGFHGFNFSTFIYRHAVTSANQARMRFNFSSIQLFGELNRG